MFSNGQLLFAALFIIVFTIAMIYVYRKDLKMHRMYYKGSIWILVSFFAFVGFLYLIKYLWKE
ncbi:hypothetical protein QW060_22560 [Myroides ceti]|uniref:NADH dehydrogenase subunit 5 n=1 Tax=Paenimyroides ceti TaxID=395087 RepID=A0ABT8CSY9_9FLAO|nr:hypothetical protein [Paenimyroides ceti]MDN3707628.1 hypothetical protein [Paenimyroides ceti]MDN3709732.1 hypothetical protein [Paenimyroides ceti]